MGSKLSSPSHLPGDKFPGVDDDSFRPLKRRRIHDDPIGFPLYRPAPKHKLPQLSQDKQQDYGAFSSDQHDGPDLPDLALRVDINKISHKDARRVKVNGVFNGTNSFAVENLSTTRARCSITISSQYNGEQLPIYLDSQICTIASFRSPVGPWAEARFSLEPFYVPREKLCIQRDDEMGFALADSYTLRVDFWPAGDLGWPPADLVRDDDDEFYGGTPTTNPRKWVLSATIPNIYHHSQHRKPTRLKIVKQHQVESATDFALDVDTRWCTSVSSTARSRQQEKTAMPSITVDESRDGFNLSPPHANGHANGAANGFVHGIPNGHVNGGLDPPESPINGLVNGHSGYLNGLPASPPEDDEELTPNRSRRARAEINYNVRQLWNTAVGKEPRKRRKHHDDGHSPDNEAGIVYILPMEQIQGEDFKCFLCGAANQSVVQLRAHLDNHSSYLFHFEESKLKGNFQVTVAHNPENLGSPLRPQVYQLGLPTLPFDFESYVEGDDSWVTSRLGPEDGHDLKGLQLRTTTAAVIAGANAPAATNGMTATIKQPPRPSTAHKKPAKKVAPRKILVPNIKQPLFDAVSKVELEAGTEYRSPVADGSWIIQKHRDTLMDFLDVDPGEKEYMREWDAFILRKHLTSDQYLARAFLSFVRMKAPWIVVNTRRAQEFSKHAAMLLARNAIDETTFHEASVSINEARNKSTTNVVQAEEPKSSPKGPDCCTACREKVSAPAMLVCHNKQCKHRVYHRACVSEVVERGRQWLCPSCLPMGVKPN